MSVAQFPAFIVQLLMHCHGDDDADDDGDDLTLALWYANDVVHGPLVRWSANAVVRGLTCN